MQSTKVAQGQTIYDIAIQHCGDQSAAVDIAILNGVDLTATLPAGKVLLLPDVVSKRVAGYYANNLIIPATLNGI